jgi:HEAT repeat protein
MQDFFRSLFQVRPNERRRVLFMFLYSLAAIGGVLVAGRAISRALFLSMLPESATPFKYILPPIFIVVALIYYSRVTSRIASGRLLAGTNLLMLGGVLFFRLLLETGAANSFGVQAALFVYFELMATLVGVQFWTFASDIFTTREARRLFGIITLGGILANILSGAGLRLASQVILPKDLLFVVVAGLLGSVACIWAITRQPPLTTDVEADPVGQPFHLHLGALLSTPVLLTAGGIMIVMSLVTNIVEYQLDLSLLRFFANDGQAMLGFLGSIQFWFGLAALLVQLFATNQIMARLGLVAGLLTLPLALGLSGGAVLVTAGALWAVALGRGANVGLRYSINDVALNLLFLPAPALIRRQAKALLDGVVKPPVVGILGLIFLLTMNPDIDLSGVQASDVVPWSYAVVGLSMLWIALALRARRQYTDALAKSLQTRHLDLASAQLNLADETTLRVLLRTLHSDDDLRVVHALTLLTELHAPELAPHVTPLLQHPAHTVQIAAIDCLVALGGGDYTHELAALLDSPNAAVCAAAVRGLCALRGPAVVEQIVPMLEHPAAEVRGAAIVGLIQHGGISGILHGATQLQTLFDAQSPEERISAARALGDLGIPSFYEPLLHLLDDPDPRVQRTAARAAGSLAHPKLAQALVAKLDAPGVARAAQRGLMEMGAAAEPALTAALQDPARPAALRSRIPRVLQTLDTPAACQSLLARLDDPDLGVRAATLDALVARQSMGAACRAERELLHRLSLEELRRIYRFVVVEADLGAQHPGALLADALTNRRKQALARLFALLQLQHPAQDIGAVRRALLAGKATAHANAVELLDMVTDAAIGDLLLPILEADRPRQLVVAAQTFALGRRTVDERLDELAADPDPWVQACTLQAIAQGRDPAHLPAVERALDDTAALVRETAWLACQSMLEAETFTQVLAARAEDASPLVQNYVGYLAQTAPGSPAASRRGASIR